MGRIDCNNYCNRELKTECEWLKEVDKFALTNAIYSMDSACQKFFKEHAGCPKLKKVKAKLHREFNGQVKSATVSQIPSGKYYVSILAETGHEELPHRNQNIGLDLGIKDLCITSDGKKYENTQIIKRYEQKLARL